MKLKFKLGFLIVICSTFTAQAWVIKTGDTKNWLNQQSPSPSVLTEMNKFFISEDPKFDARSYISVFVKSIHKRIIEESTSSLKVKLNQDECKSATQISFPGRLTANDQSKSIEKFEKQIVKIQSYDCLGKVNTRQVFETLMSDQFQIKTIDGMKSSVSDQVTNKVCQNVSLFPFGTTNTCFTQNIITNNGQYIIHSFNENNLNNPSAKVYFRESIIVISPLKNGEVSLYTLSYGRGPELPFHGIVEKVISKQQKKLIQNLMF